MLLIDEIESAIGTVHLAVRGNALRELAFERPLEGTRRKTPVSDAVRAYFSGDLHALERIEVDPEGTPFQKNVWSLLREIPVGETRTYGQLAKRLGSSARAVGSANRTNPIALVIPCHRVIAADGTLCGYASGLHRKRWLLQHELTSVASIAQAELALSR
ncbi:MAG: methylated-DNA--[protein]-cysteine S-methyltransferase [Myxococcales bacterium]